MDSEETSRRLEKAQAEIKRLQGELRRRERDVFRLWQWSTLLRRDIDDVYASITWRIGAFIAKLILKVLRRPAGITARDHIERINNSLDTWRENFFAAYQDGFLPYLPWQDKAEYQRWRAVHAKPQNSVHIQESIRFSAIAAISEKEDTVFMKDCLRALQNQSYSRWELCLTVPAEKSEELAGAIDEPRCRFLPYTAQNKADALSHALQHSRGEYLFYLNPRDTLTFHALQKAVETLTVHPSTSLLYADHDYLDEDGGLCDPYFKPSWDEDLFYAQHYLRGFTLLRREEALRADAFEDYPGWEDYAFLLRVLEHIDTAHIQRITEVLCHCRDAAPSDDTPAQEALRAHLRRRGGQVRVTSVAGRRRVSYPLPDKPPLLSVIIPTRDKAALLRGTVSGVLEETDCSALELIIVDNGSREEETLVYFKELKDDPRVTVIHHPAPFNYSELNNLAVRRSRGDVLAFLNNDLRVIQPDWLDEMLGHSLRPEVGIVGAKLYYADDTLQHAGVVTGLGGMAGHVFKHLPKNAPGYHWLPFLTHNCSAVTAACMLMRREVFEKAGGFDERHLKVAFNDVDLCLRVRQAGYRVLYTPYAELYHLESASRGMDDSISKYLRLQSELGYMRRRWGAVLDNDPFYSPNLTIQYEDYSLAWPPRG